MIRKKQMLQKVHKKVNKQLVSKYCPVSLLPIVLKFQKNWYLTVHDFLDQNCLLSANHSGLRTGVPSLHQSASASTHYT